MDTLITIFLALGAVASLAVLLQASICSEALKESNDKEIC